MRGFHSRGCWVVELHEGAITTALAGYLTPFAALTRASRIDAFWEPSFLENMPPSLRESFASMQAMREGVR
jgi:hypothetical protein